MTDCIFCKIASREISSEIVFENDEFTAFKDINPKSKIHILLVPKRHIPRIADISKDDAELMGKMMLQAKLLAEQLGVAESGYKLIINSGPDGGQIVDHLHLHILGGEKVGGAV